MNSLKTVFVGLAILLMTSNWAWSDTLWLSSGERVYGRVLDVDGGSGTQVHFDVWKGPRKTYRKEDVLWVQQSVRVEELVRLSPRKIDGYQELAEELPLEDPVARDLAIRLTVIVGANASEDEGLRKWSLKKLSQLSRSKNERRKFDVFSKLFLPEDAGDSKAIDASTRLELKRLLKLIRTTKRTEAQALWNQMKKTQLPAKLFQEVSEKEMVQLISEKSLSAQQLLRVLELDRWLDQLGRPNRPRSNDWAVESQVVFSGWDQLPDFSNITEFDPADCIFRDGKWQRAR